MEISQLRALSGSTPCEVNKKDGQLSLTVLTCFGGPSGGRTLDLGIKSPLLWPAELTAPSIMRMGWVKGLEPSTYGATVRRSTN